MATNNFKSFSAATGANVTSQTDWEALPALLTGFTAGTASSAQVNKALRQSTTIAALVGQFIANSGVDALDNGDVTGLVTKFKNAIVTNLGLSNILLAGVCTGVLSTTGNISIPLIISGAQKKCLIQWGVVDAARQSTTNVTLPVTYDNACLFTLAVKGSAISLTAEYGVGCSPVNNSTIAISNSNGGSGSTQGVRWLTIGY
ncbi:gp53-like domain-containing protein [Enterobacter soli]|uniref:gp53-like domain-containing protein n=1 Tax=Enterobacter soli TaxID=885040 RepID=UPI0034CD51F0